MWLLTVPVTLHKIQLEAMHKSKQSDFERDLEGKTSMIESAFEGKRSMLESAFEGKRSMLEQRFRALWPRKKKKHARALISNAQWPQSSHFERSDAAESKLEQ